MLLMYTITFVWACVVSISYGSQFHASTQSRTEAKREVTPEEIRNLAALFFAVSPSAALRPHVRPDSGAPARSGVVSMNLFERAQRLVKSNVNGLLGSLEDPEKILEQAVQDMQKDLVKVRQAYAEVSASSKRMEEQIRVADTEVAKWLERAQIAIEKNEDDLAREALSRKQAQEEKANSLRQQVETQQVSIQNLYDSMKELENKMAEAKAKKDQIIARARTAKASTQVNDMLSGIGTGSATAAFDKMSEKVEQLEAQADISREMAKALPSSSGGSVEERFKMLEAGSSVDDELEKMKRMLPGKEAETKAPSAPSAADDELARMKKEMGK